MKTLNSKDIIDKFKDKDLSEYINHISHIENKPISGVGTVESFERRFNTFKAVIKRDFPHITYEEIIKFYKISYQFTDLIGWYGSEYLFSALEMENEINLRKLL